MTLPCWLVGHKPLKAIPYCKWCYQYLGEGLAASQNAQDLTPETTTILDPDSPQFIATMEHERKMKALNPELYPADEDDY